VRNEFKGYLTTTHPIHLEPEEIAENRFWLLCRYLLIDFARYFLFSFEIRLEKVGKPIPIAHAINIVIIILALLNQLRAIASIGFTRATAVRRIDEVARVTTNVWVTESLICEQTQDPVITVSVAIITTDSRTAHSCSVWAEDYSLCYATVTVALETIHGMSSHSC
jgi:hypothetical protein